jgi:hypothetical protein
MKLFGFLSRVTRNINLLDRMMAQLHVRDSLASLPDGSNILRQAAILCMTCREAYACSVWIDANDQQDKAPRFCSNRNLLRRLKF